MYSQAEEGGVILVKTNKWYFRILIFCCSTILLHHVAYGDATEDKSKSPESKEIASVPVEAKQKPVNRVTVAQREFIDKFLQQIVLETFEIKDWPPIVHIQSNPSMDFYSVYFADTKAASPIPSLSSLLIQKEGRYFILNNEVFMVSEKGEVIGKSWEAKKALRAKWLESAEKKDMVIFPAKGKKKLAIYVFTDVDCVYCRILHRDIEQYNELGFEVRYLAFPRAGLDSNSAHKMLSAWCAKDKQKALTLLKQQKEIEQIRCDTSFFYQVQLANKLGVQGTPAIFTEDGDIVRGYVPPLDLQKMFLKKN